jgi:hypothetical protein
MRIPAFAMLRSPKTVYEFTMIRTKLSGKRGSFHSRMQKNEYKFIPGIATNSAPALRTLAASLFVASGVIVEHSKNSFPHILVSRIASNDEITASSSERQDQIISDLETASKSVSATMAFPIAFECDIAREMVLFQRMMGLERLAFSARFLLIACVAHYQSQGTV